jgi:hypothetical protein
MNFQTAAGQNGYYASKLSAIQPVYSSESFTLPSDKTSRYPPYPGPNLRSPSMNTEMQRRALAARDAHLALLDLKR